MFGKREFTADVGEHAPWEHAHCHYQMLLLCKWLAVIFP